MTGLSKSAILLVIVSMTVPALDIHREIDNYIRKEDRNGLERLCRSQERYAEFACYNAALFYFRAGADGEGRKLLNRAITLQPEFSESVNLLLRKSGSVPESLFAMPGIYFYEKARDAARDNDRKSAFRFMRLAIANGRRARGLYVNQPDFARLRDSWEFREITNGLPAGDLMDMTSAGLVQNPLFGLMSVDYDLQVHRTGKISGEFMARFFDAVMAAEKNDLSQAEEHMLAFLRDARSRFLPDNRILLRYMIAILWQHPQLMKLNSRNRYRETVFKLSDEAGFPKNWLKDMSPSR